MLHAIAETLGLTEAIKGHGQSEDPFDDVEMQQFEGMIAESEAAFAQHVYERARTFSKVPESEPLREEHFFFDMFYTHSHDERVFGWWMPQNHPIALMMIQTYIESDGNPAYRPLGVFKTLAGNAVVYSDPQIDQCVADVVLLCREHDLAIAEEKTPEPEQVKPLPNTPNGVYKDNATKVD